MISLQQRMYRYMVMMPLPWSAQRPWKSTAIVTLPADLGFSWGTFGVLLEYFWSTFGILLEYFWSTFGVLLGSTFGEYFWGVLLGSTFGVLLDYFWSTFGEYFWGGTHSPWMEVVGAPVRLLFILAK